MHALLLLSPFCTLLLRKTTFFREYKEALKQQRAQDVPSIYRTKDSDDQSYKTEPNTPTQHMSPSRTSLATSKSDPTPLNSVLSSPKHIFDDTSNIKKPIQKVTPSRNCNTYSPNHTIVNCGTDANKNQNGNSKYIQDYIKPKSPVKSSTGILSHDNVPPPSNNGITNGKPGSPRVNSGYVNGSGASKGLNGVKTTRNISWNQEVATEKMTFTMRREIDKAKEETDLINQLRNVSMVYLK